MKRLRRSSNSTSINYDSRVLKPTGRVKVDTYSIQLGVWKFNQYFNIIPGREKEYAEFVLKDHLPTMEKLGIKMTGGWRVVVGSGPYIVAEGTATSIVEIAKAIETPEFSRITQRFDVQLCDRLQQPNPRPNRTY